jgi:hypothetical protein
MQRKHLQCSQGQDRFQQPGLQLQCYSVVEELQRCCDGLSTVSTEGAYFCCYHIEIGSQHANGVPHTTAFHYARGCANGCACVCFQPLFNKSALALRLRPYPQGDSVTAR